MSVRSICVFCGSRKGVSPVFETVATELGHAIGERGWRLVYGAGDVGLMGAVATAAQTSGADTFGVIPEHLVKWEIGKTDINHYVVTETMHERKKVMFMNCDAVVVLPGGAGSLDEFFEVVTWRQLGLHEKPVFLLNVEGYWDGLIAVLHNIVDSGFADASLLDFVTVATTVDEVFDTLS